MACTKTARRASRFTAALATMIFFVLAAESLAADAPAAPAAPPVAIYAYHYHESPYLLEPGPHLCIDWRYVEPGWVSYTHNGQGVPMMEPGVAPPEIISKILATPLRAPFGVRLETVPAKKVGPVLKPEKPWEYFTPYTNLLHHEGKYLLYYNTTTFKAPYVTCRAESTDGIHFTKPEYGLVEFQGSKTNNIVLGPGVCKYGIHGQGIFIDPSAPPDERFKAIYASSDVPIPDEVIAKLKRERPESVSAVGEGNRSLVMGAVSPDGIHWRELPEPLLSHVSDTGSTAYYDVRLNRYVAYLRMFILGKRVIGRSETADFARWPAPQMVLGAGPTDPPSVDIYTNGKTLYPGTETMHLMFPMAWQRNIDSSVVRTAVSVDGRLWSFLPGGNTVEPGPEGAWDGGCLFPGAGLVELPTDQVAMPFVGFALPHKFPRLIPLGEVGLAVWPKERIGAIVAPEVGEFHTVPLKIPGETLYLNFQTQRSGHVKVEVVGVAGHSLDDCDLLHGDQLKVPVTWKGDSSLGVKAGQAVQLRFHLHAAKLYSFEFK